MKFINLKIAERLLNANILKEDAIFSKNIHFFYLNFLSIFFAAFAPAAYADQLVFGNGIDSDKDGLSDELEAKYSTDPENFDTDGDGYSDGEELNHGYDPLTGGNARLPKKIDVDLSKQRLRYSYGEFGE